MIQADTYITACGTGRKETANKTTVFINHTADTRRQMAGCVCVWTRQLWLSYLLDVDLPRCCLLGFTEGAIVGIAFLSLSTLCVCVLVEMCNCLRANQHFYECVFFLHSGFGASPQVYVSCHAFVKASKSHTVPQSSWRRGRQRGSSWSWSSPHVCILLIPKSSQAQN